MAGTSAKRPSQATPRPNCQKVRRAIAEAVRKIRPSPLVHLDFDAEQVEGAAHQPVPDDDVAGEEAGSHIDALTLRTWTCPFWATSSEIASSDAR